MFQSKIDKINEMAFILLLSSHCSIFDFAISSAFESNKCNECAWCIGFKRGHKATTRKRQRLCETTGALPSRWTETALIAMRYPRGISFTNYMVLLHIYLISFLKQDTQFIKKTTIEISITKTKRKHEYAIIVSKIQLDIFIAPDFICLSMVLDQFS